MARSARGRAGGCVYLLHADPPYRHAAHYLGSTKDPVPDRRVSEHVAGHGARLCAVMVAAGCRLVLARVWPGGREVERRLKRHGGARRFCPICTPGTTWGRVA